VAVVVVVVVAVAVVAAVVVVVLVVVIQTFPSVSFHRCRCVSVKCVERVLDSEAVLGVWLPAPLPTPRALPDYGALWPLAVGVEKDLGGIDV